MSSQAFDFNSSSLTMNQLSTISTPASTSNTQADDKVDPCKKHNHIHQWPTTGHFEIERCEHYCRFCTGAKAQKYWSSAWFLRRHVRETHLKTEYPTLTIGEGWAKRPQGNTRPLQKKQRAPGSNKKRAGTKKELELLQRAIRTGTLTAIGGELFTTASGQMVKLNVPSTVSMSSQATIQGSEQAAPAQTTHHQPMLTAHPEELIDQRTGQALLDWSSSTGAHPDISSATTLAISYSNSSTPGMLSSAYNTSDSSTQQTVNNSANSSNNDEFLMDDFTYIGGQFIDYNNDAPGLGLSGHSSAFDNFAMQDPRSTATPYYSSLARPIDSSAFPSHQQAIVSDAQLPTHVNMSQLLMSSNTGCTGTHQLDSTLDKTASSTSSGGPADYRLTSSSDLALPSSVFHDAEFDAFTRSITNDYDDDSIFFS